MLPPTAVASKILLDRVRVKIWLVSKIAGHTSAAYTAARISLYCTLADFLFRDGRFVPKLWFRKLAYAGVSWFAEARSPQLLSLEQRPYVGQFYVKPEKQI